MPWAPDRRCIEPGCHARQPGLRCAFHARSSARNHRGIPRQARGHGAEYERERRLLRGEPCALQLPGCTTTATSADYTVPGDWSSPLQPACLHCQRAQGAALSRGPA